MDRTQLDARRRIVGLALTVVLSALAMLVVAGCSLGPIDFGGGPSATPTPPGPTATPTTPPRPVSGTVSDAVSGKPVASAQVIAGGVLTETAGDGRFWFDDVPLGSKLQVSADGYADQEVDSGASEKLDLRLRPSSVTGRVTDAQTGKPLAGVLVKLVMPGQTVTSTTTVTGTPAVTATTVTTTTGYTGMPGLGAPAAQAGATDTSAPAAAPVITATNTPVVPTATPTRLPPEGPGFVAVYTDETGKYEFRSVPPGSSLTFKMPGYKLAKAAVDGPTKDIALDQFKIEAIYITANIAASPDLLDPLLEFASKSRINAVVLNVQDDPSQWVFDVKNPDVIKADNTDIILPKMPELVAKLKGMGFYTIARVVTFQQKKMAEARPDMCIKSSATGRCWKGGYAGQQEWLDASKPVVQEYMAEMTKEVLDLGFDEIQYDYVRFPSDPAPNEPGKPVFYNATTDQDRAVALQGFLKRVYSVVEPTDAFMSIDVFGYSLWPDQDGKPILGVIGQVLPYLLDYTDYICPMIYPSHFSTGEQGCKDPAACAYTLVHQSGVFAKDIFAGHRTKYRPWLQDFDWGDVDYTSPGTTKVADQIRACKETECWGWQWWDPANDYEPRAAFGKK